MNDWKDCTALEAHQAFVAGTHDVERKNGGGLPPGYSIEWQNTNGAFIEGHKWQYRIREKAKSITVEMPTPTEIVVSTSIVGFWVRFKSHTQRDAALVAINAAMEKA